MHDPEGHRARFQAQDVKPASGGHDTDSVIIKHEPRPALAVNVYDDTDSPFAGAPQFTLRAVVTGAILGTVIGASNMYLGFKTGFSFGAQLFGSIFGFAILKPLSSVTGAPFGPKENCTVQTIATAAGGLSVIFISAIPAMYKLELLSSDVLHDVPRLLALTFCASYFGLFFAIPLRRYFVVEHGDKFMFPTPFASAQTIKALHEGSQGSAVASRKARCMFWSFVAASVFRVVSSYAPGILWDWNIFAWLDWAGVSNRLTDWGFMIQWTLAFVGAGILVGTNASVSYFVGNVAGYGLIGPLLIAGGICVEPFIGFPKGKLAEEPTPRYWLLFPAVMVMLIASFTEVGLNGKALFERIGLFLGCRTNRKEPAVIDVSMPDAPKDQQVPSHWWMGGVGFSIVVTLVVLCFQFGVRVELSLLSIAQGFLLAFVGLQCSATTDINPMTACAKISQLVMGGISSAEGDFTRAAKTVNLTAGLVSAASASQSVEMVGDLKTGHILGASPRAQFFGQITGAFVSIFTAVGFFVVFAKAYPCITSVDNIKCQFAMPSVFAWKVLADALTSPDPAIPFSSTVAGVVFSVIAIFGIVLQHKLPAKYKVYVLNFNAVAIGWLVPTSSFPFAMILGAVFSRAWAKRSPDSHETLAIALASGLIAGEGVGGVIIALLTIFGVDGSRYGTSALCPVFDGVQACYS